MTRRHRLRLAAMLDQMPVGIGVYDQLGELFHCNRNYGFRDFPTAPSLIDKERCGLRAFAAHGGELPQSDFPCARALRGDVVTPATDMLHIDPDGHQRWLGVSAVPLHHENGQVVGAVVITQDINEHKRAMDRLATSEMRFQQFAHNSRNALWIADPATGIFEYLSASAVNVWGGGGESLASLHQWIASIHEDDRAQAVERHRRVATGCVERFEYRIVDGGGAIVRHLRATSFPIRKSSEANVVIGSIIEDISAEREVVTYAIEPLSADLATLIERLRAEGQRVRIFASAAELLAVADVLAPGCVLIDLRTADPGATDLPAELVGRRVRLATSLIGPTRVDAATIVAAMRAGAHDYLVPPLSLEMLSASIASSRSADPAAPQIPVTLGAEESDRLSQLSRRERQVLDGLLGSQTNKIIARELGISPRTVELHRAHLMERLNVRSLSELLALAFRAGHRATGSRPKRVGGSSPR